MLYVFGVLAFAVGLLASIALHEIGHMVPAKKFGVKVTQYMVGFGPTVWSRKRGDTEFGLKAIPLGGYIRMIGMVPPRRDGGRSRWPTRMATAVEEFRAVSRAEVAPGDEPRQFYRLTPGKKIVVMLGGPTMNLIIYLILTIVLLSTLGMKHNDPTTQVNAVVKCVVPATARITGDSCPANATRAPAYGVLRSGDTITSINGAPITAWQDAVGVIEKSAGMPLRIGVTRSGVNQIVSLTPVPNVKYANSSGTQTKTAGYLGVEVKGNSYYAAVPAGEIPGQIVDQFAQGLRALGSYPSKIASLFGTVFEGKERDPAGAIGVVGIGRLGGEIADSKVLDIQDKAFFLISLLAGINLLLFFFNLLPLLPLDGGHVAGALVEAVKRGRARLRARGLARVEGGKYVERQPIYVDTAQMLPIMYGVASILIVLTLLVVYADIVKPITLNG